MQSALLALLLAAATVSDSEAAPATDVVATAAADETPAVLVEPGSARAAEGVAVGVRGLNPGWRDVRISEHAPNRRGQTGLLRLTSASLGPAGYFDVGLHAGFFHTEDLIAPNDSDSFASGLVTFGLNLFDFGELAVGLRAASNENAVGYPRTTTSTGGTVASFKVVGARLPLTFGAESVVTVPSRVDGVGPAFADFGVAATGLLTWDGYAAGNASSRAHLNAGFAFENAGGATQGVGLAERVNRLLSNRWQYSHVYAGIGYEWLMPYATPFTELWVERAVGVGGSATADGRYELGDTQVIISPGVRWTVGRGLHIDTALDVALAGTDIVDGVPALPPWSAQVGLSYTFSPFAPETMVEIREKARPSGVLIGCVLDADTARPVLEAYVEFVGASWPRIVNDEKGCFESPKLDVGALTVRARHPEYLASETSVVIADGQVTRAEIRLQGAPRLGQVTGTVTDQNDQAVTATLLVTDAQGHALSVAAADGSFETQLPPGAYQVIVAADGFLKKGARLHVEPHGRVSQSFVLRRMPKERLTVVESSRIGIKHTIPFEFNKARLLQAASFILDDVVDRVLADPGIDRLRVEGHTDNIGDATYNQDLSEARARTVLEYLVAQGVARARLESQGFGASRPLTTNGTERGRAVNRRVDFIIVERASEGATSSSAKAP